jgi:NADPH:quinone reductase-like Zn-dependent oxidoreductase
VPYSSYEGTYAEYVLLKEEWIAPAPQKIPLKDSAGVPLVYLTALQALEKATPKAGQRVLVLGASGAVGQFGVQLAKLLYNLHVTAVSSPSNFELVKKLGADEVWDYAGGGSGLEADFSNKKFDIVFDVIGGELLDSSAKVLVDGGVITHIMNR